MIRARIAGHMVWVPAWFWQLVINHWPRRWTRYDADGGAFYFEEPKR